MKIKNTILMLAVAGVSYACASISSPEGGARDTIPPTLTTSNPKNQELNVKGKSVSLTFDEPIQAKNLTRELLITPNTNNKYKTATDKNTITLTFDNPLQENTTYTLNFREGLADITESNVAKGLKLAFSTGSFIDSSMVSGTVVDLLTQQPEKDALVALYPTSDTLTVRKDRPYYQTQTDSSGNYTFTNIKEGEYRIYALIDKNKNAIYDNEAEKIGYLSTPLNVTPVTDTVKLQTVRIDTKRPILLRRENYLDQFIANYSEGIKAFSARPLLNLNDSLFAKAGTEGKAIQLFKTDAFAGGKTVLTAVDSAGNIGVDTIQIDFTGKRAQLIRGAKLKVTNTETIRPGQQVTLELQTPVSIKGAEPIAIIVDSVSIRQLKYPEEITLDPSKTELSFLMPDIKASDKEVSLRLDSTAILPLEGDKLKFNDLAITMAEAGSTGSIKGRVVSEKRSYIIQLLDSKYKVVTEVQNKNTFNFTKLAAGQYFIRVLVDENNNGVWDQPDPKFEKPVEPVYFYPQPINVRENWDIEDIKLTF